MLEGSFGRSKFGRGQNAHSARRRTHTPRSLLLGLLREEGGVLQIDHLGAARRVAYVSERKNGKKLCLCHAPVKAVTHSVVVI